MRRVLTLLGVSIVLLASALGHAQSVVLRSFESDIRVAQDGSALVIENYEFAHAPGRFERTIPTAVPGVFADGRLYIEVANVNNDAGTDLPFRIADTSSHFSIRVAKLVGTRLQIAYRVNNAVQFGAENDEFVWIANPPGDPLEAGTVSITFPDAVAGQLRAQAFLRAGAAASRAMLWSFNGQVPARIDGTKIESDVPGTLSPGVSMVVHASLPAGILSPPNGFVRAGWFLRANLVVLFPFAVLAVMLVIWRLKPRDADPGRSIAPMYEPPPGLTPGEVGLLVDDRVDPRDITATLIDLAVRGYVRLERTKPEHGTFGDREDYIVRLLKPREQWTGLAPHEVTMLFHTFYGGQWTQLSSLSRRFPDIVPAMRSELIVSLKQKGMYRIDPDTAAIWQQSVMAAAYGLVWLLAHSPLGIAYALASIGLNSLSIGSWPLIALSLAASAAIVYALGRKTTAKTLLGMRTLVAIRGFEEFIRTVEGDKLSRLEPGLFEKYLPYAMALGLEHKWTRAFEGIAIKQPEWTDWAAAGLFNSSQFGYMLDAAFSTAPKGRNLHPALSALG